MHLFFTLSAVISFPNMEVALPNMEVLSFVRCFRFKSICCKLCKTFFTFLSL